MTVAAQNNKPSSHKAFTESHSKTGAVGHATPFGHLKPANGQMKLPAQPQKAKPVSPVGFVKPVRFVPKCK